VRASDKNKSADVYEQTPTLKCRYLVMIAYIHTYIHTYIHVCMRAYVYRYATMTAHAQTYTHTYTCRYVTMRARACVPPSLWWESKVQTGWPWDSVPITAGKTDPGSTSTSSGAGGSGGGSDRRWKAKQYSKSMDALGGEGCGSAEGGLVGAKSRGMRRQSVVPTNSKATGAHAHAGHVESLALSEMVDFSAPVYSIKFEDGGINSGGDAGSSAQDGNGQGQGQGQSEGATNGGGERWEQIVVVQYSEERKEWVARGGAVSLHGGSVMVFGGLSMHDLILAVDCSGNDRQTKAEGEVGEGDVLQTMLEDAKYASVAAAATSVHTAPAKRERKASAISLLPVVTPEPQKPVRDSSSGMVYVPHVFTGDAPSARRACTMSYIRGKILVYGGRNAKGDVLDDLYVLDLVKKRWSCVFSYYAVRSSPVLASIGARLITSVGTVGAGNARSEARWLDYDRLVSNGTSHR
jgi:hypothetical protein